MNMNTKDTITKSRRGAGPRRRVWLAAAALALPALTMPTLGIADDERSGRSDHEEARRALLSGEVLSLRQVLDRVARDYPGEPIEIEFERDDGIYVYELKLVQPSGRIIKMKVDATTGNIIKVKARGLKEEDDD